MIKFDFILIYFQDFQLIKVLVYLIKTFNQQKYQMQQASQNQYPSPPQNIARQISELSCNQHYILLYPIPKILEGQYKHYFSKDPYLLIFEDEDNSTQRDLAAQFIKETNIDLKPHYIYLSQLNTEYPFRNMKLSQFKRLFQLSTIDGCCFELSIFESEIELETCLVDMIGFQKKIPPKAKSFVMYLQEINYYFNVECQKGTKFEIFTEKISRELKKELNIIVKPDRISLSFVNQSLQSIQITSKIFRYLTNKDYIYIKFLGQIPKISKPIYQNQNSYIIIQDITLEQRKFIYKQIRKKKISTIFDKDLGFEKSGLKSSEFGLRIHDLILKPYESLSDFPILDELFLGQSKYVKIVLAIIVKESFMFYSHLQNMGEVKGKNKIEFSKILFSSQKNQSHRRQCETAIKDRAKKVNHQAFKNSQQRIQPILLYTSELLVKQKKQSTPLKLYDAQNTFLRSMNFGEMKRQDYNRWELWFAHSLMNNLKLIEQYKKGDLYRGVSYKAEFKIGSTICFKQFISCSINPKVALSFANTFLFIFKNCKIGRQISDFSFYMEEEVLNFCYSSYKVTKIQKQKNNLGKEISAITLQQVSVPQIKFDLKDQRQLFVLWVDGQKGQGVNFSRNISQVTQTTYFVHMKSTKQLQIWLIQNKQKLKDPTINISLITNMFRNENGVPTENAGALAIKVFKTHYTKGNILVYIGDMQKAKKTLAANQVVIGGNIQITNTEFGLLTFFADYCGIS